MQPNNKIHKPNYRRRAVAILLFLLPLGLVILSLICNRYYPHVRPFKAGSRPEMGFARIAVLMMLLAIFIAVCNLYIAFIRPALYRHRPDYRYVSGCPVIGTLFVILGAFYGFGRFLPGVLGLAAMLLDIMGPIWFLVGTLLNPSWLDDWIDAASPVNGVDVDASEAAEQRGQAARQEIAHDDTVDKGQ